MLSLLLFERLRGWIRIYCEPLIALYDKEGKANVFILQSVMVHPARDEDGRKVMIRFVSGEQPSTKLQILKLFNSEPLRSHKQKNTILVIEFI